jgi:IS5 family transposase
MANLLDESIKEKYRQYFINDPLKFMKETIDWNAFPPLLRELYHNNTEEGGRPNIPIITMVKILFLQSLYNLSDQQAEKEIHDRISFMNFLDYPDTLPDSKTIWFFRERLSKTGRDRIIWTELQRQLDSRGIRIKGGTAQDATFITSDPGHEKHEETREIGHTRRSKDGTFTKKNNKTFFGYKGHILTDLNSIPIIRSYAVTTASVHDSKIDLSRPRIPVYRDKGYFGVKPKGYDATMNRAMRCFKLSTRSMMRNWRISRKRALVEYPFAIIKRVFHFSHTLVTLSRRVRVKFMFSCFSYNIFAMRIIESEGQAIEIK